MISIDGTDIERLPFRDVELINVLLSFEGDPVLCHLTDDRSTDLLSYWVDFDNNHTRWLYCKISKQELFDYLIGKISLKELLTSIDSSFLFFRDFDANGDIIRTWIINSFELPEKYLPKDDSFYLEGLSEFYSNYLTEFDYLHRLRENSYVFLVESSNKPHSPTVSTREAALVLNKVTNSIESYIGISVFNAMKNDTGDLRKINKRINTTKERLSPRIAETKFHSFEVWVAIDTITFNSADKLDVELRNNIIDGYKKDVLDVDFSNEEDAKLIATKYTEYERKKIFAPLIDIFENDDFDVTIKAKGTDRQRQYRLKTNNKFKGILFPPHVDEEIEEKRNKIVSLILNIREGEDVTRIKKRELMQNLLFAQDVDETVYSFDSSIEVDNRKVLLKRSLKCTLSISENGNLQLYNNSLDLYAEGHDIHQLTRSIKRQFVTLVDQIAEIEVMDHPKATELRSYIN